MAAVEPLVVAARITGERAQQFAVLADDPNVIVGDEQPDRFVRVGSADRDVPELAVVAQGDRPTGVDAVRSDREVNRRRHLGRSRFDPRGERDQRRASTERPVRPVLVVVGAVGVELQLQVAERRWRNLLGQVLLEGLVEPLDRPQVWGWYGVEWMQRIPNRSSCDSIRTLPLRDAPLNTAALSPSSAAG